LKGEVPAQRRAVEHPQLTGVGQRFTLGGEPQQPVLPAPPGMAGRRVSRHRAGRIRVARVRGACRMSARPPGRLDGPVLSPRGADLAVGHRWGGMAATTPTAAPLRVRPALDAVVKRLDTERVPGAEQLAGPGIPDGEGVHAAEPVHDVLADSGVGLEQDLGVTRGSQDNALLTQLLAKLDVVVDLAVVD